MLVQSRAVAKLVPTGREQIGVGSPVAADLGDRSIVVVSGNTWARAGHPSTLPASGLLRTPVLVICCCWDQVASCGED